MGIGLGRCIIPSKAYAGRKEQCGPERTGWPSKGDALRGGSEPSQMLAVPFLPASKNRKKIETSERRKEIIRKKMKMRIPDCGFGRQQRNPSWTKEDFVKRLFRQKA